MRELTYVTPSRPRRKKPGPTARYRAKRKRAENPYLAACRKHADLRDGACKLAVMGGCDGPTDLMHLRPRTKAQTRGMPPEFRHTFEFTMNGCRAHHKLYDDRKLELAMVQDLWANGPMRVVYRGRVYMING